MRLDRAVQIVGYDVATLQNLGSNAVADLHRCVSSAICPKLPCSRTGVVVAQISFASPACFANSVSAENHRAAREAWGA